VIYTPWVRHTLITRHEEKSQPAGYQWFLAGNVDGKVKLKPNELECSLSLPNYCLFCLLLLFVIIVKFINNNYYYVIHHYRYHSPYQRPVRIQCYNIWFQRSVTHLLKCSRIFSSRILSGRFPTQRWRVSLTIMSPTLHHSGTRPNTQVAHDSTAVQRIRKCKNHTRTHTHTHLKRRRRK